MKADIYTGFLTNKVKVFSTQKEVKPRIISGHKIRRGLPLVLASLMVAMPASCSQNTSENEGFNIELSANVIPSAEDKEFLSETVINEIMQKPSPAPLKDINFNHLPENQANFWEIVRNGVAKTNEIQASSRLDNEKKTEYRIMARKMLAQINHVKGDIQNVDLRDFNNLKTFLYFEKVLRYGDKYQKVLGHQDGVIDERTEIFGRYYQDQEVLKAKVSASLGVQKFAKALYACDDRFVLNYNDSLQANEISREVLADWLTRQNVKDTNLWYFVDNDDYDYCNVLAVYSSRGNPVQAVLGIDPKGDLGDGFYSPVGSVIIHELQHLMQKKPSSKEKPEDNQKDDWEVRTKPSRYDDFTIELGPTLYALTIEDKMYKKIHGIAAHQVVDYGSISLGTHKISVGETAVWFSKMLDKYPHQSVDKVLLEPEVFAHLNALGNNTLSLQQTNSQGR